MRNYLILVLLIFLTPSAFPLEAAVPDLAHPLTLPELVELALENNPATRQSWWNARRAAAAVGSAKSVFYPQVDLDASITNGRTFKFINGPDTSYTIVGADLVLSMMLYDGGVRKAQLCSAKNALLAANWQSDWAIQKVIVRVLENAYALSHALDVLQAYILSLQDAEKLLSVSSELNRAGLSPISDVYAAQATLLQTKLETVQQRASVEIQKGKLLASLGLSAESSIELAPFDQLLTPPKQQVAALIELASHQRADLLAQQASSAAVFAEKKGVRASYGPSLSFAGVAGANHAFHDKANALQYQATLNLEIPLFSGFDNIYQNRIAYAEAQLSLEEMRELQISIALDILTYSRSLDAAQEMLPDAEANRECSQKAYEGALERYRAGKENIAGVSYAWRQLASARIRYSDIKTRWLVSLANLAYATGTLAPYMEGRCTQIPCEPAH